MTEQNSTPRSLAALAAGLALAVLTALGGPLAVVGGWLAQPAFALAVSWRRGTRLPGIGSLSSQLGSLAALWLAGGVLVAVLAAWPLSVLLGRGSLYAALSLSLAVSLALLAFWRVWPLWHELQRDGGGMTSHWRRLTGRELQSWQGLRVAVVSVAICVAVVLLAWPGAVPEGLRWPAAIAFALLAPLGHWWLQAAAAAPKEEVLAPSADDLFAELSAPVPPLEPIADADLTPALYDAARSGRVDRALQLLDNGADVHALPDPQWRDQRSLVVLAAVLPDLRLLRAIIAAGGQVNVPHRGMTPLLAATRDSWHGRPEAVMTLLANGADPRACDVDGNTPLHHAARSSDPGVAALLLDAAADINALNGDGYSPLAIACQAGNWRLARFLLERGAQSEPVEGVPALVAAAGTDDDDPAGVQLLFKHKARLDARDRRRRSALHEAAAAGHVEVVGALLAAGGNVEARDGQARTPWLEAAAHARLAVLEQLVGRQPDINALDNEGCNALRLACSAEGVTPPLVRHLLDWGVEPHLAANDGRRAVDAAAEAGRWAIVAMLDPAFSLPAAVGDTQGAVTTDDGGQIQPLLPDRAPVDLLREALGNENFHGMEAMAKLCAAPELTGLLRLPALALKPAVVDWLISHGADAEQLDDNGDSLAFMLLGHGAEAVASLQVLLRKGVSMAGAGGLARFLAACLRQDQGSRGNEQFALELLERGADPFAASDGGDPALSLAVRLGWLKLQQALLAIGIDLEARDSHGMTALHLATALAREAALKQLVLQGASPDARAADGQTPLGVALAIGRRDLAQWLDWRGWPLPLRPLINADVPAAATAGDADAVRRLVDLGLPLEAVDAQGATALLRAAGSGHLPVVEFLLKRGANVQHAASSGATPLSAAVSRNHVAVVKALIAAGAPLDQRLPGGVTVMMLASALGLVDIVALLLAAGADVAACDDQQLAPLHCAALFGFTATDRSRLLALLDTLLLAGAEADQAAGSVTPLLLMLGARAEPGTACNEPVVLAGVDRLLDEQVSLDVRDPRGFGPLHLAALHGLPMLVQRLLRAGADPEARDALNRVPRDIAIMRGFIDVAGEFEPAVPGVSSMARFLRDRSHGA